MPYERKRRCKRKRRYKKRRSNRARTGLVSTLGAGSSPFPPSYLTSHRYVETFTLNPGVATPDVVYYSCNSLFDPTSAVGGHQPLGFDQMTVLYDHYTVIGAKATIRFFSDSDSPSLGANMCYSYVNDDSTAVLTYDTVLEQGKGVVKSLTTANSGGTCTVTQKFSAKKFFGITDVKDNEQLKGTASTSPAEQAFFVVGAQGVSAATNPGAIYCNITVDYITIWTERKDLAQS